MCTAIALAISDLPVDLVNRHGLGRRIHDRAGRQEYQFHWWQDPALLPVRRDGQFEVLPWGCRSRRGPLPFGGWISQALVADGVLGQVEQVVIPAMLGLQKGTWFIIVEGILGVAVDTRNGPLVYMLMEPSTNYYRNMTEQSAMMPVLLNQVI